MQLRMETRTLEKYLAPECEVLSINAETVILAGSNDGTPDNGDYGDNPLDDLGD